MNDTGRDKILALAGIFQAAKLAQELARQGRAENDALEASVRSVLITDSISTIAIYGGLGGLATGLRTMCEKMRGATKADEFEIARYVLQLVQLTRKLQKNDAMVAEIAEGIEKIKQEPIGDDEVSLKDLYAELAQLYKDTISTMRPKIIVQGEHGHLANPEVVDKVRTVLLAGIRSAYLWLQLGGSRWQLVFGRRNQMSKAEAVLAEIDS